MQFAVFYGVGRLCPMAFGGLGMGPEMRVLACALKLADRDSVLQLGIHGGALQERADPFSLKLTICYSCIYICMCTGLSKSLPMSVSMSQAIATSKHEGGHVCL